MKNYDKIKKLCEKTKLSTNWNDYEALEWEILQASYDIEDTGDKTDEQRRKIDDQKEDKRAEIREKVSSDAWATKMVNKEFRELERPVIVAEEIAKRDEKRLKASIRRAEVVKSRQIKMMADDKRQWSFSSFNKE
jgi:hypothetical protein